jgi:8-oxo-dGTP pyrophosphatase MutT (NUDIX family)
LNKIKKWELLNEENISPSQWFPLFKHTVKLPNGKVIDDFYVSKLSDVAMILPITEEGELVFVKQYKHGIREITIEFPAGIIEPSQTPEQAAFAELEQETGIIADKLTLLGELRTQPSKDGSKLFGFLAQNCKITKEQKLDDTEEIEVVTLSLEAVNEMILKGEINCSDTIALYTIYKLTRTD